MKYSSLYDRLAGGWQVFWFEGVQAHPSQTLVMLLL